MWQQNFYFKHLKGVGTFLILEKKDSLLNKILKEIRIPVASVVELDILNSNLRINILRLIT